MRLPWPRRWRRRSKPDASDMSVYRPGSWAEIALPPHLVVAPTPSSARSDPRPEQLIASRAAVPTGGVRLGFTDGTHVDVDAQTGRALKDVAGRLLGDR